MKHGHARSGWRSPEYTAWQNMIQRCNNPRFHQYRDYGGRGIEVCPAWRRSFAAFLRDVGQRPAPGYTLDRWDNERGYEPGNVRWATRREQQRNRRAVRAVSWCGVTVTVIEWSEATGIDARLIAKRLDRGWSVEDALSIPTAGRHRKRRVA